jgi:MFS family permease
VNVAELQGAARARWATVVVFATQALLFASWTAHIPLVKERLHLGDADLGMALFGAPIGSLVAMLLTGWLLPRLGSRRMVQLCLAGYCATAWTVGVANSWLTLFAALILWGAFQGSLDVSMNAQALFVERRLGKPVMSGFQGTWSLGAFVGVAIGALAVSAGVPLVVQLVVLSAVVATAAGVATRAMVPDPPHHEGGHTTVGLGVWLHPVVIALGAIVLAGMLCEGAVADWSAVYLRDSLGAAPGFAALGYASYSAVMVVQRLAGDRLLARFAPRTILPVLAAVATVGMIAALLVGSPMLALAGFATLGLGLALVIPAAFTAVGRLPGIHAGSAVAAISAIGWIGFVAGPPLIGHIAEAVTLPVALGLLPLMTGAIALTVRATHLLAPALPAAVSTEA